MKLPRDANRQFIKEWIRELRRLDDMGRVAPFYLVSTNRDRHSKYCAVGAADKMIMGIDDDARLVTEIHSTVSYRRVADAANLSEHDTRDLIATEFDEHGTDAVINLLQKIIKESKKAEQK